MFWHRINEDIMNTRKIVIVITCILLILPGLSHSQIVPDFNFYSDGALPDIKITDDNIHLVYGNPTIGIKYLLLDTLLNPVSETILIENTRNCTDPSIDIINDKIALSWCKMYSMYDEIHGTVFQSKVDTQISSLMYLDNIPRDNRLEDPKISFLNDTLLVAVWFGALSGDESDIWGQLFTTSNKLVGANFLINEQDQYNITSKNPLIHSFKSNLGFVVIWIDDRTGEDEIYGRLFECNGTPIDSSFLITDVPIFSDLFYNLSMDMDSSGNFIVTWCDQVDSDWNIYYCWFNKNAEPLTDVISLTTSTNKVNPYSDVDCSISDDGNCVVIWESKISDYSRIYAQRFSWDRIPIGEPFRITSNERPFNLLAGRVFLSDDRIYTFWGESGDGIWANVLDFNNPVTSIDDNLLPNEFSLSQNYPNPLNPTTTISYNLPESQNIKLQVFDITGRLVETLVNGYKEAGHWEHTWDASMQSSGIYIYRLTYGDKQISRKMVVLK